MKDLLKTSWDTATGFFSKKALVAFLLLGILLGGTVLAQGVLAQSSGGNLEYPEQEAEVPQPEKDVPDAYAKGSAYTLQNIVDILGEVRDFILIVGIIFIVIMIVWAGIQYVTAGGDEEKQEAAKQKVVGALIGAAIILAAFALIATIRNLVESRSLV
jgi:cytochrome bd-type quinol oxidase subunit 2